MAATQHAYGTGPHGQHGPAGTGTNGPQPPGGPQNSTHSHSGSYRSQSEDQHPQPHPHPRPFFFLQPSQPLYPYQWPVPMPYNPYCGFPGLGYGMVMPPFPPTPYMEAPGYIVPHAQLHLADYRRMVNPHFTPTVAYHARRFRYQQNGGGPPRETINTEVQTETPPSARCESRDTGPSLGGGLLMESDSGRGSRCTDTSSPSQNPTSTEKPRQPDPKATATPAPVQSATPKGVGYVYQKEEVRIECGGSPAGLKIVRSQETTAESGTPGGDLLQCDVWSVRSAEGVIPLYRSSVHEGDDIIAGDELACPSLSGGCTEEQCVPSYPDILLVGGSPNRVDELPALHGCDSLTDPPAEKTTTHEPASPDDMGVNRPDNRDDAVRLHGDPMKNVHFKILRLPFELQYLEDLRKLEESVWSVESLVPYIPSAEWMMQHGFMEAPAPNQAPTPVPVPVPLPVPEKAMVEAPMETSSASATPLDSLPSLPSLETSQEVQPVAMQERAHQRGSVSSTESLPPYLPSASWLADFGNVYYYSKLPLGVQEQLSIMGTPARKTPGNELKDQHVAAMSVKERRRRVRKLEGRDVSERDSRLLGQPLSDRGRAPTNSQSEEGRRNCMSCLTKLNIPTTHNPSPSPSPSPEQTAPPTVKRHRAALHPSPPAASSQKSPTCSACERAGPAAGKATRKKPALDILTLGRATEDEEMEMDEAVENRASPQPPQGGELIVAPDAHKQANSKRHSETCSMAQAQCPPKLREQNCSCDDPLRRNSARDGQRRSCPDTTVREGSMVMAPSNPFCTEKRRAMATVTMEQKCLMQKCQTGKSWRASMALPDQESCENGVKPRTVNKPKKAPAQVQESHHYKRSSKAAPRHNVDFSEPIEGYYNRSNWTKGTHRRDTRY